MTTNPKLDQARKWAKDTYTANLFADPWQLELAEVINSLPDEWIDADELRKWMDNFIQEGQTGTPHEWLADAFTSLQNTFLTPTPRTLADMTPEEREACQWMQARLGDSDVILTKVTDTYAAYVYRSGTTGIRTCTWFDQITPLPDLPRMVWPGEQATEEDMSIIPPKIDTSTGHDDHVDMTPQDVPEPEPGQAWLIDYEGDHYEAVYWHSPLYAHAYWALATSREGLTTIESHEATPVSRLVPEVKA